MRGRALKVLLIEDDLDDLALFEEALLEIEERLYTRKWMTPCELVPVDRISEALECLRSETFDVVLLDLTLPDAHGPDAFVRVRASAPDVPVIVLVSEADESLAITLMRQGAQDYLIKSELDCLPLARSLRCAVERSRVSSAMKSLAFLDDVTGLYTPGGFHNVVERLRKVAEPAGRELRLFLIDLEGLDSVEQTYGSQERDMVLILAADALREAFAETDVIARLAFGRFIVASLTTEPTGSLARIESVKAGIESANSRRGGTCNVSVRVASVAATDGSTLDQLIEAAESSLCENKRSDADELEDRPRCYLQHWS
jgi:diguanylate cyclase (GGDEF)-like protein